MVLTYAGAAAALMRGTGRFHLAQGLMALSGGIGAGLSNLTSGFVVQWFGYSSGFLSLAGSAVGGLIFSDALMPETRPFEEGRPGPFALREGQYE